MQAARLIENSAKPSISLESWSADRFVKTPKPATERDELLLLATDRFCSYDDQHRLGLDQYKEAFYSLVSTAAEETLSKIAKQLSTNAYAPREVILYLAGENVRVSEPILQFAPLLSQLDMVQLIEQHDNRHARLLASRPDLGPAIIDRLMRIEDEGVRQALVNNRAVTFDAQEKAEFAALSTAAERTKTRPKIEVTAKAKPAVQVRPQPKSAAKPKFVVSVKRNNQHAKPQQKPVEQDLLVAAARGGRLSSNTTAKIDTSEQIRSVQDITTFAQNLERMALARNHQGMATLMKKQFNLAMNTCREVLEDESGDTLAVLMCAAGVNSALANRINLLTFEAIGSSVENARRAIQFFSSLDQSSSLEAVKQWPKSTLFTPRHESYLNDADGGRNRGDSGHKTITQENINNDGIAVNDR